MSAEELGKRLLAETAEEEFDEILNSVRASNGAYSAPFGFEPLDRIIQTINRTKISPSIKQPPVVEFTSIIPGAGKTHLIYYLTSIAVLPTHLGGRQSCVILLDNDARFSTPRLVQQLQNIIRLRCDKSYSGEELDDIILSALKHVLVFHPPSQAATISIVQNLPSVMFDPTRHSSFERRVGFIALDSASAFYWQVRSDEDDAALVATSSARPSHTSSYSQLAAALKAACATFSCPLIVTSWYLGPPLRPSSVSVAAEPRSFRPSLPMPWNAQLPAVRLVFQRAPVRRLPEDIAVREALQESENRQTVVAQGKFECFVNEWGLNEGKLRDLQTSDMGFEFWIREEGVVFDAAELNQV